MNLPDQPNPKEPAANAAVRVLCHKRAIAWLRQATHIDPLTGCAAMLPGTRNALAELACGYADYAQVPACEVWLGMGTATCEPLVTHSDFVAFVDVRFREVIDQWWEGPLSAILRAIDEAAAGTSAPDEEL